MPKYYHEVCPKGCTATFSDVNSTFLLIGASTETNTLECEGCGFVIEKPRAKPFKKSLGYPHHNMSLGRTVESREHEDHIASTEGFTRTTHEGRK